MDLGFGNSNQVVGGAAAKALLQQVEAQASAVDAELSRYDSLLDDDAQLEQLRAQRLEQMKKERQQQQQYKAAGHGVYSELASGQDTRDVAKDFFEATKASERLVVHFYRPTSASLCDVFHKHLERLATRHLETRFVKINVENCSDGEGGSGASFLVDKLGIVIMPTLVLVKKRQAVHHIRGFDELGATDDFSTKALEYVLGTYGIIHQEEDVEIPAELLERKSVNAVKISKH